MVLVDSSVWIDYFNGVRLPETDALDASLATDPDPDPDPVLVGDLILTEVLQGFRTESAYEQVKEMLASLVFCQLGGRNVALAAAENYRLLRSKGITVRKAIDVIIASDCILDGIELLHQDRDFDPFEQHLGLRVCRRFAPNRT